MPGKKAKELLAAAREMLASRYSDGECDAVAISNFAVVLEEIDGCSHSRTITTSGDEVFMSRIGCLDCNKWLNSVRLRER